MSVSWSLKPAPCGRRACARRVLCRDIAAVVTLAAASGVLLGPPSGRIAFGPATVLAAVAWIALALCRCRCGGTLDGILADPPLPRRWTRADWDRLARDLTPCPDREED